MHARVANYEHLSDRRIDVLVPVIIANIVICITFTWCVWLVCHTMRSTSYFSVLFSITSRHVTSHNITSHHITSHHITSHTIT